MWRAEAGIPSSVGGGGGYFPNATALLRRILRLTFQHAALSSDITNEWNSTQRLVSVWIHDNGGSGWTNWETAEKFTQNGDNKKKRSSMIGSVLRVKRPGRPHKYADGGALFKESGLWYAKTSKPTLL